MSTESGRARFARRCRNALEVTVQITFVVAAATLVYANLSRSGAPAGTSARPGQPGQQPPVPAEPISLDGVTVKGDRRAKVAVIEYSDFQCPYCGKFATEVLPTLEEKYVRPGKLLVAFRHLPLPIHAMAQKAAEAAECAGRQGRFWDMHDLLFQDPRQLAELNLRDRAATLGLNAEQFDTCLKGEASGKVRADAESGRRLAIGGTPAFLIGTVRPDGRVKVTERFSGARPVATFEAVIDNALASVRPTADSAPPGTR
jgi:protein-disulfide isomerase